MQQGKLLEPQLTGRLKLQIRVLIYASNLLVKRMRISNKNLFSHAPKLSKLDWGFQFLRALISI